MESTWELVRTTSTARVGGVCGALANRWRVDPILVRTAAVILALCDGLGLVVYALGWLFLPADDGSPAPAEHVLGKRSVPRGWIVALGVMGVLAITALLQGAMPFGWFPAIVLGIAVWHGTRHRTNVAPATSAPPTPTETTLAFEAAAARWNERVAEVASIAERPPLQPEEFFSLADPAGIYAPMASAAPVVLPSASRGRRRSPARVLILLALVPTITMALACVVGLVTGYGSDTWLLPGLAVALICSGILGLLLPLTDRKKDSHV